MAAQTLPQLFGVVPTGCPVITTPTTAISETSFIYTLPTRSFSHIVVFLLPGIALPPDTAAAVYISSTPQNPASFKFLGGIGQGKESAIFKVGGAENNGGEQLSYTLGVSVEPAASVAAQMSALQSSSSNADANRSTALVTVPKPSDTVILAQKIIKNAFNFLASFSGNVPVPGGSGTAGVEVVPLKAFEDWWRKFEGKIKNDPRFLERDGD
ncbi:hypothetical protein BP5796_05452 [Coleophoma crateriformis]|uniref:Uncharacterized protein n=1 Tax=Coleophoma crateriformis TaxID=565419 RepID=A0A3D8S3V7_9HELO|nr:hypothetical protein BP5796_05452 [Coleophoma crateriformis]